MHSTIIDIITHNLKGEIQPKKTNQIHFKVNNRPKKTHRLQSCAKYLQS